MQCPLHVKVTLLNLLSVFEIIFPVQGVQFTFFRGFQLTVSRTTFRMMSECYANPDLPDSPGSFQSLLRYYCTFSMRSTFLMLLKVEPAQLFTPYHCWSAFSCLFCFALLPVAPIVLWQKFQTQFSCWLSVSPIAVSCHCHEIRYRWLCSLMCPNAWNSAMRGPEENRFVRWWQCICPF